jgi:iron complex outermembrane receptor protein
MTSASLGTLRRTVSAALVTAAVAFLNATAAASPVPAAAQEQPHGRDVHGTVLDAGTGQPLPGTLVHIPELRRSELTHADGTFHLEEIPRGEHVLRAERIGYRVAEVTVVVANGGVSGVEIRMEATPLSLSGLTVTASMSERSAESSLRPVGVVADRELLRQLDGTVAATLRNEPGVAVGSMGPATARPVIRGLSGDRVLMLQDGERTGDLSAASSDHATAVDPLAARRIEVVRGPAALLYGSNALGGVVNVIKDEVPTAVPDRPTGTLTAETGSVNRAVAGSGAVTVGLGAHLAFRGEATVRSAGELRTPAGPLENTDVESIDVAGGGSWVGDFGFAGASYRHHRNEYGIPGGFVGAHPDGVRIELRRHQLRAEAEVLRRVGSSLEASATVTDYAHEEIEAGGILGTAFRTVTATGELRARHAARGPLHSGAFGVRFQWEDHAYGGSLSTADTRTGSVGLYLLEEVRRGPVTVEGGVRYDRHHADPAEDDPDSDIGFIRRRTFDAFSGSLGLLFDVGSGVLVGGSASRAFRTPGVAELFSEGPHLAAYSFEVGNPDLDEEVGLGLDVFVRLTRESGRAELAFFRNAIDGYLFPRNTGEISRVGLPIHQFTGADALLQGVEAGFEWNPASALVAEGTASYVHGELRDAGEPIPFIPPLQGSAHLRWEPSSWFASAGVRAAAEQDRIGEFETRTDGYAVVDASLGVRTTWAGRLHTITVRVANLFDETYRNHLSRTKEVMPEAGRGVSLLYRVVF